MASLNEPRFYRNHEYHDFLCNDEDDFHLYNDEDDEDDNRERHYPLSPEREVPQHFEYRLSPAAEEALDAYSSVLANGNVLAHTREFPNEYGAEYARYLNLDFTPTVWSAPQITALLSRHSQGW